MYDASVEQLIDQLTAYVAAKQKCSSIFSTNHIIDDVMEQTYALII